MIRRAVAVLFAMAAGAVPLLAHDGHDHGVHKMSGTVKAVHADLNHVELDDKAGQAQAFYVDANTKYLRGSKAATLAELKPGTRVVVNAKTVGDRMVAVEVKVGGKPAGKPATAHQH